MAVKKEYKQTEVGVMPEDWLIHGFNALASIPSGQVDPKQEPFRSMVLVAPDHIESGSGRLLKKETAAEQKAISGKYLFAPGDVLYSKIRPYLRKATIAEFSGLCSADMYPLRPSGRTCAGFLLGVILGYRFSKYAESVSVRSGMPKINRDELSTFYTALPPTLAEQEAIAGALSDADAWIESLEQLIAKKRQIKQGAMQELLTGKRRLPGFSGKWETKRLGEFLVSHPQYGINAASVSYSDRLPAYIRITDITEYGQYAPNPRVSVYARDVTDYFLADGDLVFARTGASVGKSYRYRLSDGPLVFAGFLIRIRPIDQFLNPRFLEGYVTSEKYWNWVRLMSMRSGQPGINGKEYAQLPIELPSIEEQTAIATVLSDMDTEIESLEAKLAKAREVKQGMMQELLTGRIRLV